MSTENDDSSKKDPLKLETAADKGLAEANAHFEWLGAKTNELMARGILPGLARSQAFLEQRVKDWPPVMGDDLVVILYGDLGLPERALNFPALGITIEPEKVTDSFIKAAQCILRARVRISEKSVEALADAATRLNTLLGIMSALDWGNGGNGWWSSVTHGTMAGSLARWQPERIQKATEALEAMDAGVKRKVRSALYWIREPRALMMEGYRPDVLRLYAGYWNAFECLIDAMCQLRPPQKLSPAEKREAIDSFFKERGGELNAQTVSDCYNRIVNPGLLSRARHALQLCFPDQAEAYFTECFQLQPRSNQLYAIRNAINHGEIDADNPIELLRVEERHRRLWLIVFGMLGMLLPIDRPIEPG